MEIEIFTVWYCEIREMIEEHFSKGEYTKRVFARELGRRDGAFRTGCLEEGKSAVFCRLENRLDMVEKREVKVFDAVEKRGELDHSVDSLLFGGIGEFGGERLGSSALRGDEVDQFLKARDVAVFGVDKFAHLKAERFELLS